MDKTKNFETELPEGYVLKEHVDAKSDKKTMTVYSVLSLVPVALFLPVLIVIAIFVSGYRFTWGLSESVTLLVACFVYFAYIPLHELVHGITYKIYTGGKLTFGFSLVVAFCGVPQLYVRRKAAIAALIMPFAVFSVVFMGLTVGLWFISPLYGLSAGALFLVHFGGCVGDLHWTFLYLTKLKGCETLMRDTGPEQWVYVYDPDEYKKQKAVDPDAGDSDIGTDGAPDAPADEAE